MIRRGSRAGLLAALALPLVCASLSSAEVAQKGNVRISVDGSLAPKKLPRSEAAPISVSVGGKISTTDGSEPPQLKALRVEINRHGRLDTTGLPVCSYHSIQPASTQRALAACRNSLVGTGSFEVNVALPGQPPYPSKGKLLLFNGRKGRKPVIYGQIYAPRPFATSFVVVFAVRRIAGGNYGTELLARIPAELGSWGFITGIQMRLSRQFGHAGRRHSFLSASCPAPKGFTQAPFPLARISFRFARAGSLHSILMRTCGVRV
ncbi:MAG TPA: hypothetical protein VN732_03200 [Solirubrobacterales bacterium]|nr:hypothetical protein [Solirubrobacterales bacterium]